MSLCDLCPFMSFKRRTDGLIEPTPGIVAAAGGSEVDYPKRATMWHDESRVTNGNARKRVHQADQDYSHIVKQDAAANGDVFTNGCCLQAGTYTFYVLGVEFTDRGIIDWKLDGVEIVGNQDWYGAGAYNIVKSDAAIEIASDGWHVLTGTIDGKNGSSSGYAMGLTKMWFEPAAD